VLFAAHPLIFVLGLQALRLHAKLLAQPEEQALVLAAVGSAQTPAMEIDCGTQAAVLEVVLAKQPSARQDNLEAVAPWGDVERQVT
jgi:hypothetical protein